MNSVFEMRMREACKRLNAASRRSSAFMSWASQRMPSPRPSTKRLPKSADAFTTMSSSSFPSTWPYRNHSIAGIFAATSMVERFAKNFRARNVAPSVVSGRRRRNLGDAFSTAARSSSVDSMPEQINAWPPSRCSRGDPTSLALCSSVTPSGLPSGLGRQSTPTGASNNAFKLSAHVAAEMGPSTTMASTLFQSFCTSPSCRKRRPSLSHKAAVSRPSNSSACIEARTEPSTFRGTSSGKSHFLRPKWPSRRPFGSSKGSTPLPKAVCATSRSAMHGFASNSGSSVNETRIVSPRPSRRSAPMPTADLMRPSEPPPASVTPKCIG
mmetsp:Transcript_122498/g.346401  ORF Transcript_122498/g.346401 Transcript_122498/m.346401 type:complete len:325 (-) Transcript_122498:976-1950(-)